MGIQIPTFSPPLQIL